MVSNRIECPQEGQVCDATAGRLLAKSRRRQNNRARRQQQNRLQKCHLFALHYRYLACCSGQQVDSNNKDYSETKMNSFEGRNQQRFNAICRPNAPLLSGLKIAIGREQATGVRCFYANRRPSGHLVFALFTATIATLVLLLNQTIISHQQQQQPVQLLNPQNLPHLPVPLPLAATLPLLQPQQQQMISKGASSTSLNQLQEEQKPEEEEEVAPNVGLSHGPGVDLVGLNWRRFELDHRHQHRGRATSIVDDLRRGELIESQLAAIPDKILSQLPAEASQQLIETLAADASLVLGQQQSGDSGSSSPAEAEDPDDSSVERLSKSCLTVQASSLSVDELNVTFHLFTRRNPNQSFVIKPQASRLELLQPGSSPFRAKLPIKWITHGFHTNLDKSEWMLEAKDKILANEDANVILTDWRRGATPALAFYPKAVANAHVVARMIVRIMRRLWADIDLGQVHLIGHSLGAHIMGFVGSAFTEEYLQKQQALLASLDAKSATGTGRSSSNKGDQIAIAPVKSSNNNQLIGRITACDPALPCFGPSSQAPNSRLSGGTVSVGGSPPVDRKQQVYHQLHKRQARPALGETVRNAGVLLGADDWTPTMWTHLRPDSAVLVEVMHSNPGVMGYAEPLGDFDFFPNGSDRQPGCNGAHTGTSAPMDERQQAGPIRARRQLQWIMGNAESGGGGGGSFMGRIAKTAANRKDFAKTLGDFIKPIRDFFLTYTCSHHRSVEYMVESMYYNDQSEPSGKPDGGESTCQMVGYRCSDYHTFKRGHCFLCRSEFECRSFGVTKSQLAASASMSSGGESQSMAAAYQQQLGLDQADELHLASNSKQLASSAKGLAASPRGLDDKQMLTPLFGSSPSRLDSSPPPSWQLVRNQRDLPTLNQYKQDYRPQPRNQYYFDTKPVRNFCLHHYHLMVKYRWFRLRNSVLVDRLSLIGSANHLLLTSDPPTPSSPAPMSRTSTTATNSARVQIAPEFNMFTHHSYTMLVTSGENLGKIDSLLVYNFHGDKLKSQFVEYINVTYMSNLDPLVRASRSARLCLANANNKEPQLSAELQHLLGLTGQWTTTTHLSVFVRCTQDLVR